MYLFILLTGTHAVLKHTTIMTLKQVKELGILKSFDHNYHW